MNLTHLLPRGRVAAAAFAVLLLIVLAGVMLENDSRRDCRAVAAVYQRTAEYPCAPPIW